MCPVCLDAIYGQTTRNTSLDAAPHARHGTMPPRCAGSHPAQRTKCPHGITAASAGESPHARHGGSGTMRTPAAAGPSVCSRA